MIKQTATRPRSCATDPRKRQPAADARIPARAGFTLVELLVVILIIAALAAISIVVVKGGVAKADHSKCLANVKQLVAATVLASTDLNGRFPEMEGKSGPWMQDVLWPYVSGGVDKPTKVPVANSTYTCPARQNSSAAWAISIKAVNPPPAIASP